LKPLLRERGCMSEKTACPDQLPPASTLDGLVVAPDATVGTDDEELESDACHCGVLCGDHLPVELDDVGETLDVISWPRLRELAESSDRDTAVYD
jgi:hypothetical protein